MSGLVQAHHPSADMNPNFELVDDRVSDMHIEVVDNLLDTTDQMSNTTSRPDTGVSNTLNTGSGPATMPGR